MEEILNSAILEEVRSLPRAAGAANGQPAPKAVAGGGGQPVPAIYKSAEG